MCVYVCVLYVQESTCTIQWLYMCVYLYDAVKGPLPEADVMPYRVVLDATVDKLYRTKLELLWMVFSELAVWGVWDVTPINVN